MHSIQSVMNTHTSKSGNSVVTPFFKHAYKIHRLLFRHIYPHPLDIEFDKQSISVKVDNILQLKYIPFFIALVVISTIIGFGSCAFLPLLKLFHRSSNIGIIGIVFCLFLGSCSFLEWATYVVFHKSKEIVPLINQLFEIERKCKFSNWLLNLSVFEFKKLRILIL